MSNFADRAVEYIRDRFCLAMEGTDRYWNTFFPSALSGFSPFARTGMAYRAFCNREPPTLPESAGGGQCPVLYRVSINIRVYNTTSEAYDINTTYSTDVYGYIIGLKTTVSGSSRNTVLIHGALGNPDAALQSFVVSSPAATTTHDRTRILSIVRLDGLPDNCGSNPPPLVNPNPGDPDFSSPITIVYDDDNSTTISLGGVIAFGAAFVDADLNLVVPFTLNLNGNFNIPIRGTINLNGGDVTFNYGSSNSVNGGGGCKDPAKNFDTDDPPVGGDDDSIDILPTNPDDEDEPVERLLRGVICYVSGDSSRTTEVPQDYTQDLYVPRAGNVQFLIQVGNTLAWSADYPVRCNRELIVCDWPGGARDVRCTPYGNFEINLQKVYYPSTPIIP